MAYLGETYALITALIWGFAVILFKKSGETVHPISLNLFKNLLAIGLFLPTMMLMGEPLFRDAPRSDYYLLLASGILGIGISDTLFFQSLNLLGASLSAIVDCMYSPFIIALSILWLGESLTPLQVVGVIMIISAVLTATLERSGGTISRRNLFWGVVLGVLAMATMAVGIVGIKPLLERSPLLWALEWRLVGGVMVLVVVLLLHPGRRAILGTLAPGRGWKYMLGGSFLGTYLALLLWLAGMKYADASIAAALNQSSNVFVFIFAAIFLKEVINTQRIIGIALGIGGVFVVMMG
ncbi:MAG: DMT family transporter [Candidatus Zixiibacteriota bacterium]|nr:MAG: DMT family transporter [candidate division Zixibacteria bacterium]